MFRFDQFQTLPPEIKQMVIAYYSNPKLQTKENAERLNQILAPYGIVLEPNQTLLGRVPWLDLGLTAAMLGIGGPLAMRFAGRLLPQVGEVASGAGAAFKRMASRVFRTAAKTASKA